MTSFGYRLNPHYTIKECLSCGALYTRDFCCSKGNVEDKILVPKLPKSCARCGHPVDGPYCQGCDLLRKKLEEDLVTYFQDFQNTFESSDDSTKVVNAPREPFVFKQDHGVNPPHIDECYCECGDVLDGIFYQQCTCKSCGKDEVIKSSVEDLVLIPSESEGIPDTMCDVHLVNNPTPLEAKDHFEIVTKSNDDISSSDDDFLYNKNIKYVDASPYNSELVSLEVAEIVILKDEEIEDNNLRKKLLNVHLLIANIEALKDNPTPSSKFLTKSSSTSPKSFLEETNTFHNSLPEFENFCFDLEEISSGSTTTHSDISLPDYEAFYFDDDHIKEISSGSTTTHFGISLSEYDSFIFDLSNDQFPPTDRSDFTHEEFADELAHIISPPEYDCFYFRNLPDPGEFISILNSGIRENLSSTTRVNLPVEDNHSPLLAYVVWIFLAYLTKITKKREKRPKRVVEIYELIEQTKVNQGWTLGFYDSEVKDIGVLGLVLRFPKLLDSCWSISITFQFSVRLQTSDDLSRSRLGFIEKMGVKGKQEKDKIRTKPEKNRKREKARQCRRPITVKKAGKEKKIQVQGAKQANPRSVFNSRQTHGLILHFTQSSTTGGVSAILAKLFKKRTSGAISSNTLKGHFCQISKLTSTKD
nr:hypothetical protein [Tanacetum cinerariifolium]